MSRQGPQKQTRKRKNYEAPPADNNCNTMAMEEANQSLESSAVCQPDPDQDNVDEEAGPSSRRPRKAKKKNFTDPEIDILVDAIQDYDTLFPQKNDAKPPAVRMNIWNEIMVQVNAVCIDQCTVAELRKKWNDMRSKVKSKMSEINRESQKTGGGPPSNVSLTGTEEKIAATYTREQVEGIGNADVCSMALESENSQQENNHGDDQAKSFLEDERIATLNTQQGESLMTSPTHNNANATPNPTSNITSADHMGLSDAQFIFFSEYTQRNIELMDSVDKRVESHLSTIASALISVVERMQTTSTTVMANAQVSGTQSENVQFAHDSPLRFPNFGSGSVEKIDDVSTESPKSPSIVNCSLKPNPSPPTVQGNINLIPLEPQSPTKTLIDLPIDQPVDQRKVVATGDEAAGPSQVPPPEPSSAAKFLINVKAELVSQAKKRAKGKRARKRRK